jgi:hypothetical protein
VATTNSRRAGQPEAGWGHRRADFGPGSKRIEPLAAGPDQRQWCYCRIPRRCQQRVDPRLDLEQPRVRQALSWNHKKSFVITSHAGPLLVSNAAVLAQSAGQAPDGQVFEALKSYKKGPACRVVFMANELSLSGEVAIPRMANPDNRWETESSPAD